MVSSWSPGSFGRGRGSQETAAVRLGIGEPDDLVADDLVREAQVAVDTVERSRLGLDLEHHVRTFVLVVDLVGEAALAPLVGLDDGAAGRLDRGSGLVDHSLDSGLIQVAIADNHHFVGSHREHHLLDPVRTGAPVPDWRWGKGFLWTVRI